MNFSEIAQDIHSRLSRPYPRIAGLCAFVVGMGRSGKSAAELLLKEGAHVCVYDIDPNVVETLRQEWLGRGVQVCTGELEPRVGIDFCVVSPGVPPFGPFFTWLRHAQIPLLGEMELACRFLQRPILAVTGTNGKTTVVYMISHILQAFGYGDTLVGNVGTPIAEAAAGGERTGNKPLAVEVSSFQCETFEEFKADAAVITNLAPDHLDRYSSINHYYETKFRIAVNQAPSEALWLGPGVGGFCPDWVRSQKKTFNLNELGPNGIYFCDGTLFIRDGSKEESRRWPSLADHLPQDVLNRLAAIGVCTQVGIPATEALQALESFTPLPHRLEWIGEVKGIRCYNDSKATNIHALAAALRSLPAPILLIAGGRAKGDPLDSVESLIREKVRSVYLIGEAAEALAQCWNSLTVVHRENSLEAAVAHGLSDGKSGDSLLLSPGCASYDMFKNYAERGDRFKQAVKEYPS